MLRDGVSCPRQSSLVDSDPLGKTVHTVLALSAPRNNAPPPDSAPESAPEPGEKRDQQLARRAAAILRPASLLRAAGGCAPAGPVAAHEILEVRWADVESRLETRVTGRWPGLAARARPAALTDWHEAAAAETSRSV